MGECGCGEIRDVRQVVRVGNKIMVVEVYPGCENCGQDGIATTLHLFTKWSSEMFGFEPQSELTTEMAEGLETVLFTVRDLVAALDGMPTMEHYDRLSDWIEDNGLELLQRAIVRQANAT